MRKIFIRYYLIVIGLLSFLVFPWGCNKDPDVIKEETPRTILDVPYMSSGSDEKQKMDVYLPGNRSTEDTRVLILIHGGGFVSGDRKDLARPIIDHILDKGWALVNVSYRLVNATGLDEVPPRRVESDINVRDQVDDVSAIVDFVLRNSREWAINGHRIGIAGHSAGGSLALLYAYDERNTNRNDNTRKVKAVGNWAGTLDLAFDEADLAAVNPSERLFIAEYAYRLSGYELSQANNEHFRAISPYYAANIDKRVPTISIFPEYNDVFGLPRQDRQTYDAFTARLNELEVPNYFIQIDGADHGFGGVNNWLRILDETIGYFNESM